MKWLHALPARVLAPLLLMLFAGLAAYTSFTLQLREFGHSVELYERERLIERLGIEQTRLEVQGGLGNQMRVRRLVTELGLRSGTTHAFLVDDQGMVVASISRADAGRPFPEVLRDQPEPVRSDLHVANLVSSTFIETLRSDSGNALIGVAPIDDGQRLLMRVDLDSAMSARLANGRAELLREAIGILLLAGLLWLTLHLLWFRRSRRLTDTAAAIGAGRLDVRCGLEGRDELARLGKAIDAMADDIQARQSDLENLSAVINRSPVIAFEWQNAPGWPVQFVSKSIVQWGYSRDDFMRGEVVFAELIHPEDKDRIVSEVAHYLTHGPDEYRQEYRLRTADGAWLWVDDRTWLTRDDKGEVKLIHGVLIDISRQKTAERELQALNAELERRVEARTAELESLNKELESFSYSVSHDLKAPLRGIDGYSQILLEDYRDRLDDDGRQFLENIRRGVGQMHQLIEDMLAYSRMERRTMEAGPVALGALVDALVSACNAEQDGVAVEMVVKVPALAVNVDSAGLALVVRNLLENAIKFSRTVAHPRIEIGAEVSADRVLLWVADNGIGFDMKYHDRIFDIFQRLHRAEDYPGTGVGLALVRKAVARMGGKVWATSEPGQGARFFVELPIAE